jgi:hypothetical protein
VQRGETGKQQRHHVGVKDHPAITRRRTHFREPGVSYASAPPGWRDIPGERSSTRRGCRPRAAPARRQCELASGRARARRCAAVSQGKKTGWPHRAHTTWRQTPPQCPPTCAGETNPIAASNRTAAMMLGVGRPRQPTQHRILIALHRDMMIHLRVCLTTSPSTPRRSRRGRVTNGSSTRRG